MSTGQLHIVSPDQISEAVKSGRLNEAILGIARLAGADLTTSDPPTSNTAGPAAWDGGEEVPVQYHGKSVGRVLHRSENGAESLQQAARAIASVLAHVVDRETAVGDLAEEMIACYEELNMLYSLLPSIATRVHASDIAEVLVDETMRTLHCRRVSLLMIDESRKNLKVLAARGLPDHVRNTTIPLAGTISGRAIDFDDCLIVNDLTKRPEISELSRGDYTSDVFAVIRVPLRAQGEAVGVLTVTDRADAAEFTARDRKLLEGLAAMGASALLNCRLHGTINRQMISTIQALASAIDAKDQYTHAHSARVAQLVLATARELGMTDAETCREVELAGLLHDIGKIGIPDAILSKAGRLTPEEFVTVQRHTEIGAGIVEHVQGLERVAQAVRHHHERYDGLGYPSGLARDAIPVTSRMIAIADVFDVLTSDRPYREAIGAEGALRELNRFKGTQFNPTIVDAFQRVIDRELARARLNNGHDAEQPVTALLTPTSVTPTF